ncbi:phage tail tube protein [Maricaulis sp.]|uniref:phage tail tube protein n=1 Tax=Maricaulis sp. TaxID=1486257 RepID=UPI003A937349
MVHLVGREAPLYTLAQAAAGTAAAGNYNAVRYYPPLTPRRTDPLVDDPLIGVDLDNVLDVQDPASGLVEAGLDINVPLCFNELGFHLRHLLAAASPSGDDPYTHVFTSGARSHAGGSYGWVEGAKWRLANTVTFSRMELGLGAEAGQRQVRLSGMASDIETKDTTPLGTPVAALAANIFPAGPGAQIYIDDVLSAVITGGSAFYQRTLVPFRPAGRAARTALEFTPDVGGLFGGSLEFRAVDDTIYNLARNKTDTPLEFRWVTDSGNSLSLACPAVQFEPYERPVAGSGLRTESASFRGKQTADAPCLTATLVNSIGSYAVES